MALEKRPLGSSGIEITTVGLGAWAIGGGGWSFGWGKQDDEHSIGAIRHAVELGVNWIDTAAIYGLGHSQKVVGRAVSQIPQSHRPMIFTKCGLTGDRSKPFDAPLRDLRPETIRRECEDSLRCLGLERIDLYQFHWPDPNTPIEDSWA
jgi:aryl-alcohol dehydrogenase-like predicted oxidoreductase